MTTTERKPLSRIIEDLRKEASKDLESWIDDTWYSLKTNPPDVLAVIDQLTVVSELAPAVQLPMSILFHAATTLSNSKDTDKAVIGGVLLQCHREISKLSDFCQDLESLEVDYPCQVTTEPTPA